MPRHIAPDDPPPVAPTEPQPGDCCGSGCNPCIFDIYQDALERYRAALDEWNKRQGQGNSPAQ